MRFATKTFIMPLVVRMQTIQPSKTTITFLGGVVFFNHDDWEKLSKLGGDGPCIDKIANDHDRRAISSRLMGGSGLHVRV